MTISPNELRIGNWFIVNWSNEKRKADWMDIRDISEGIIEGGTSPIPLTPEVLEKFGFNDFNELWIEDAYGNDVVIQYDFGDKDLKIGNNWYKCEYLHKLQNIVFDLSGKELEYKP